MTQDNKKVLIVRLTSLGDVIFTLPLANCLKENGYIVDWLVAEKGLGVVKGNPCVNKVHFVPLNEWRKQPFSFKKIKEFWKLVKELRAEKYDIALDCQQMFKSLFLFWFSGAKRRITFKDARELSNLAGNEFIKPKAKFTDSNYHIVERNLDFARHLGLEPKEIKFSLPETSNETKAKIDELIKDLDKNKKTIVISPATTWVNKHWNEGNWIELVEKLKDDYNLIFTGTKADENLIARIRNNVGLNLCGKTNIEQLRELFSRTDLVVSPDSGSSNLAWASQKPAVIAIFTCTPPKRFGPYGDKKYVSLTSVLKCQPCFKKRCKLKFKKNICCKFPTADKVVNIIHNLL